MKANRGANTRGNDGLPRIATHTQRARTRRRGYTLLELVAGFAVLSVITGIAAVTYSHSGDNISDGQASSLLDATVTNQHIYYRTRGNYQAPTTGQEGWVAGGAAFATNDAAHIVGADTAVTDPGTVGIGQGTATDGGAYIAAVTRSRSGTCFAVIGFAPSSGRADIHVTVYTGTCSVTTVTTTTKP